MPKVVLSAALITTPLPADVMLEAALAVNAGSASLVTTPERAEPSPVYDAASTLPLIFAPPPSTCSISVGKSVPIPTLPSQVNTTLLI